MIFYDSKTLPVSRWRNGGGETREIISFPPEKADFSWRVSIATLAADGPFSLFPGVDRIITLLEGEGVELNVHGKYRHQLLKHQPFAFAGEDNVVSRLTGGISTDFNVMTRRDTHQASVVVRNKVTVPSPQMAGAVYVLTGEWRLGGNTLIPGQGAWWETAGQTLIPVSADALLLQAQINRVP